MWAARASSSEKSAADDGVDSSGPDDVDLHVAGNTPHQIHTVAEAGESPRIQHRVGVGIHDLNGLGSSAGIPIHGVEGELVEVAVTKIHVKGERAARVPGGSNLSRATAGLQGSRIGGAGSPGTVGLVLDGKRGVRRNVLGIVGHRITIRSVDSMPTALRAGIGSHKVRGGRGKQIDFRGTRSGAIRAGGFDGHLRRCWGDDCAEGTIAAAETPVPHVSRRTMRCYIVTADEPRRDLFLTGNLREGTAERLERSLMI